MEEYKPNSHKYKEAQQRQAPPERKKIEKVVTGTATIKKKTEFSRLLSLVFAGDPKDIPGLLLEDVIIPLVKRGFLEAADILVNGKNGKTGRITADRVSWRTTPYDTISTKTRSLTEEKKPPVYSYDRIVLESRSDAEAVLMGMDAIIEEYGVASVADLCELADVSSQYTDNRYGWSNFSKAEILRSHSGYILKLPKPVPIENIK